MLFYADPGADGITVTDTINQTGNYTGAIVSNFGLGFSTTHTQTVPTTYYSNWQLNTTGFPGPAPFRQGLGSPMGNLPNPIAIHSDVN
jgi:hypothetical protein